MDESSPCEIFDLLLTNVEPNVSAFVSFFANSSDGDTDWAPYHTDEYRKLYANISFYITKVVTPILCTFGVLGNILNIATFVHRHRRKVRQTYLIGQC